MALKTTKPISLDLYNNAVICINAKQYDTESRYIKISCTENGKKMYFIPSQVKAFVRYKKPDGFYVLNEATVTGAGDIIVELTQQMLAIPGRAKADLILFDTTKLDIEINENTDFSTLKTSILSTMYLDINIYASPINESEVESSYEYNALLNTMTRMLSVEIELKEFQETAIEAENQRQANEIERVNNEENRIEAEKEREIAVENTISECNTAVNNKLSEYDESVNNKLAECDTAISNAEKATEDANTATGEAIAATEDTIIAKDNTLTAIENANLAAERANTAAEHCEDLTGTYLPLSGGTITGTLVLSNSTDLSGVENNSPALIIGGDAISAHMEIDNNEIQAKSGEKTTDDLWLNSDGGTVHVGTGGLTSNGAINSTGDITTSTAMIIGDFVLTFDSENKRLTISQA